MLSPEQSSLNRGAVACTLAAALALGAGRWGSYIGHSPLFLTDILVIAGVVNLIATRSRARLTVTRRSPGDAWVVLLVVMFAWAVVRFVTSMNLSVTAVRDFAPYAYTVVGIASFISYRMSSAHMRAQSARILEVALYFHVAWIALTTTFIPDLYLHLPQLAPSVSLFGPRNDYDEAVNGIAAALLLLRSFRGERPWLCLPVAALAWVSIFQLDNRGGFIGAALASAIALFVGLTGLSISQRRKLAGAAVTLVLISGAVFALPRTTVYQRVTATFTGNTSTTAAAGASGTADARRRAWSRLLGWDLKSQSRTVVGVGFGPDFMTESGAALLLTGNGDTDVRSPHNYWLGTFSREGVVGVGLFGALIALLGTVAFGLRRRVSDDPLLAIAILVPAALVPPASVGVILESPFGAVPFFWCAGVLLASAALHLPTSALRVPLLTRHATWAA